MRRGARAHPTSCHGTCFSLDRCHVDVPVLVGVRGPNASLGLFRIHTVTRSSPTALPDELGPGCRRRKDLAGSLRMNRGRSGMCRYSVAVTISLMVLTSVGQVALDETVGSLIDHRARSVSQLASRCDTGPGTGAPGGERTSEEGRLCSGRPRARLGPSPCHLGDAAHRGESRRA